MGAFGLAVAATVRALLARTVNLSLLRAALRMWPLLNNVLAPVVAWGAAATFVRLPRSRAAIPGR